MLPRLITLSRFFADSAKATPWGRAYPRRREGAVPLEEERPEKVEIVEEVETHRSNWGHDRRAGVGETEGDGDDPRVNGGDDMGESSHIVDVVRSSGGAIIEDWCKLPPRDFTDAGPQRCDSQSDVSMKERRHAMRTLAVPHESHATKC